MPDSKSVSNKPQKPDSAANNQAGSLVVNTLPHPHGTSIIGTDGVFRRLKYQTYSDIATSVITLSFACR